VPKTASADKQDAFAIVRLDSFGNFTPLPENVTVAEVLKTLEDAEDAVRRLNRTAPTGTVYFVQATTFGPRGRTVRKRAVRS
jgi:hypothetical protein